jgi:hypothetical protein
MRRARITIMSRVGVKVEAVGSVIIYIQGVNNENVASVEQQKNLRVCSSFTTSTGALHMTSLEASVRRQIHGLG